MLLPRFLKGERQEEVYPWPGFPTMTRWYKLAVNRASPCSLRNLDMDGLLARHEALLLAAAQRLHGHQRRLFLAEVTLQLCDGNPRQAERRFGWGRDTVSKGLHELQQGIRCLENFAARARPRWEEKHPQLAQDIRAIVEPHTHADPELKSERRYTNLSAAEVLQALQAKKGYADPDLPKERTMRDILNRMNYRLKRVQKAQ